MAYLPNTPDGCSANPTSTLTINTNDTPPRPRDDDAGREWGEWGGVAGEPGRDSATLKAEDGSEQLVGMDSGKSVSQIRNRSEKSIHPGREMWGHRPNRDIWTIHAVGANSSKTIAPPCHRMLLLSTRYPPNTGSPAFRYLCGVVPEPLQVPHRAASRTSKAPPP